MNSALNGVLLKKMRLTWFIAYTKSCQETADTIQSIHMHMQHITKYWNTDLSSI